MAELVPPTEAIDAPIGDNQPPEPIDDKFDALSERTDELIQTGDRWIEERPTIEDDDTAEKATLYLAQVKDHKKACDEERLGRNRPLHAQVTETNKRFTDLIRPLDIAADKISKLMQAWLDKKEAEAEKARLAAEAEAKAKQEEADRKAREAAEATDHSIERQVEAEKAEREAETAAKAAKKAAKPVKVSHAHGATATRSKRWTGRLENRDDLDIEMLKSYFTDDELNKAIRAYVAAGGRALGGAIIEQVSSTSVR